MLGTFGLIIASLVFFVYAFSTTKFSVNKNKFPINNYAAAYHSAGLACMIWAAGTVYSSSLLTFVVIGDALIMLSSLLLLSVLVAGNKRMWLDLGVGTIAAIAALWFRASVTVKPIVENDVLVFSTPRIFGLLLILVLFMIWLRANMKFYDEVAGKIAKVNVSRTSFYTSNLVGFIGVCGFLFAHKQLTIVLSFTMLLIAMASLSGLNYAILNPGKVVKNAK